MSAPTLMLIMGLGLSGRSWDRLPALLSEKFRVITFDNRGTGRSSGGAGFFRMATLADDAASVLEAAGVSAAQPAFVFGVSLGGMVAQELALRHASLVKSLALGATWGSFVQARRASLRSMAEFLQLVALGPGEKGERLARLTVSEEFHRERPEEFENWMAGLEHGSVPNNLRQLVAVLGHSTLRRLPELKMPTLVMTGEQDAIIPAENSREIARRIPGAQFVEFAGVGHVFPLERPLETVQALASHFA
ncbi:MAG: alpha/beta fold hydrolase [Bdellovibrionota bacterium]